MNVSKKNLLIIAGEVSGDSHAASVVKVFQSINPEYSLWGIGGHRLAECGQEQLYQIDQMAFLGIGEVIKHLPFIRRVQNNILREARVRKPQCVILVDYPGFNLRMARFLKKLGIPVLYYISPQLWAWGRHRVKKVKKYIDELIVLFPFEEKFYRQHGIPALCAGHPLVDKLLPYLPKKDKKLSRGNITLGLLPGSRKNEVASLLSRMVATAQLLKRQGRVDRAEIVKVPHLPLENYKTAIAGCEGFIQIKEEDLTTCLPRYDAVMVASGTATLECGFVAVPMLVVYSVNALTYRLGKMLIKLDSIGLVNIVAESIVAPELIQDAFTPQAAAETLSPMLEPEANYKIRRELKIIRTKLGKPGADRRAAIAINDFLKAIDADAVHV